MKHILSCLALEECKLTSQPISLNCIGELEGCMLFLPKFYMLQFALNSLRFIVFIGLVTISNYSRAK